MTGAGTVSALPAEFAAAEYADRLARTRAVMQAVGCELLLVDRLEDVHWLTGASFAGTLYQAVVVGLDAPPVIVLRRIDEPGLAGRPWGGQSVGYADWEDPVSLVLDRLSSTSGRVGIDGASNGLTVQRYRRIAAALGDRVVDASAALAAERTVKSDAELAHMWHAAGIADRAMADLAGLARPGTPERELAVAAAGRYLRDGASCAHVGPLSVSRGRDDLHGTVGHAELAEGDVVHAELLPEFRGYAARIMRSVAVGRPDPVAVQVVERLVELQDAQLAAMVPGAGARDVDAIVRDPLVGSGLRTDAPNVTGYAVGLYGIPRTNLISDFTRTFTPAADWVLRERQTFHMYVSARGLAVSETVVVTRRARGVSAPRRAPCSPGAERQASGRCHDRAVSAPAATSGGGSASPSACAAPRSERSCCAA
ncbi:hypothetical protein BJF78_19500 [Pseudonocardia sp. CNS-139]|nr:hypothetical protein BJF78_19500 [Pseudonocardia sp. CNS-139]